MFKSHETRNDTCPECDTRGTMKNDSYWNDRRTNYTGEASKKYRENSYVPDDDEYCSCNFSDFEESSRKPTAKNRQSAGREASKFPSRDKSLKKHTRYDGSIIEAGQNSASPQKHDRSTRYTQKSNRKSKSSKLVERMEFPSSGSKNSRSVRVRAREPDCGSKYRSKSLGARVDRTAAADLKKNCTRRKSKVERSLRLEDKSGKIVRRYSRRDVKKADGVTEVTSLEVVKNWSGEAASERGGQKNLGNARWPSRKSTKVIFARYSQDSMDDDVSERSESLEIRDGSEEETCVCDDEATNSFDADCEVDDFSQGCVGFVDEPTMHDRATFADGRRALRRKESCTCYDCPIMGKRVGVSRQRHDSEVERSKKIRSSNLDQDAAQKGTRILPAEKLTSHVVGLNNKYSSLKARTTERRTSLRRVRLTGSPNRFAGQCENFSARKGRNDIARRGEDEPSEKRILSKMAAGRSAEKRSERMADAREKFCKMANAQETKNMMNCCCASSQLDEDHGCSADCRCPESFFTNWRQNLETPDCPDACCPEGHRDGTGSALKNRTRTLARTQHCCGGDKKASRITNAGYKTIDDRSRLSRIGYVEERVDECDCDVGLGERHFHGSDDRQPCENLCCPSIEDSLTICCCPEEETELKVRGKLEAGETSCCDDSLNIADLCPEVPPPDHWTKCGDRLNQVTEEYRILLSRLRDMQREAETPEISGRVRKRISRKYPSGKEFSFEVKTIGETGNGHIDDCGIGETLDENGDADLCRCEEPVDDRSANWRESQRSRGRNGSSDRHSRSEKTTRDRFTRAMSEDDIVPCDCSPSEKKKKRKRWKAKAEETDLVKTLEAFCAKVKAMDRELEASILTSDDNAVRDKIDVDDCECDESDDVEESELLCDKYCDACVGTVSAGNLNLKSDDGSDDVTMAPRITKRCGASRKTNLKKIFIYPPDGEEGPPLTLLKKSSDIDCTIVSDSNNRFRYKVTYKQNFLSPAWCPVDQCCGRDSDEYRNTDDYG